MNTNQLKKFAQSTRKKLLEQVSAKLDFVLTHETAELREKASILKQLKDEVNRHGKQQITDKVAYTWFNRFVTLRFMDINDYQPLAISIVTALPIQVSPQILQDAMAGNIPTELQLDKKKVIDLLDGKIASRNAENDAYRLLLIAACNHLNKIFPFLFEKIDDYTELLLPDDLTSQFSVLHDFVEGMTEEDCQQVECIGWLYQFYISEKKDEVFASKEKVKKEDIPAATQLFTPRWIVEYMVQNTVGKLWMMNHPNSTLRQYMPYYIESEASKTQDYLKINSPEELTLLDQACGSGHILVYGFELFYRIYAELGDDPATIPAKIIKHNLFGFEIDERAAQLSGMALLMKAREYQPRLFKKAEVPIPNILCYQDLTLTHDKIKETLIASGIKLSNDLTFDIENMQQATNLGSLIIPKTPLYELHKVKVTLENKLTSADLFLKSSLTELIVATETLIKLSTKFCCVVDNPPYMGGGNANKELGDYVKTNYPDSKADLMACFMEAGLHALVDIGMLGMINQHSWMFLSSYEGLRKKLIDKYQFDTLLHLGPRTFPEIGGEVVQNAAFTFFKKEPNGNSNYIRLIDFERSELKKDKTIEAIQNPLCGWNYISNQSSFDKIPGSPIGYWLSEKLQDVFIKNEKAGKFYISSNGIQTGDNDQFIRLFHEISYNKKNTKWFPYNKGGTYRKWFGNNEYLVNWENNGIEIKGKKNSCFRGEEYYFSDGVTWSDVTSGSLSCRYFGKGFLFDASGPSAFAIGPKENLYSILGVMNAKYTNDISKLLNPTIHFQSGNFRQIPFNNSTILNNDFNTTTIDLINCSKSEWDSREQSWEFKQSELIRIKGQDIEETYDLYQQYWSNKFHQLHKNEEELNRQFIEIYGLEDELTPNIQLEDITILKQETNIESGELVFNAIEIFAQFISYSVGCMFGRYSLDKEGLILACQGENLPDYFNITGKGNNTTSFLPDEDNIIPVLEDEWFEDDIVAGFYKFLKVTFGEKNFRTNLNFIEEQLGKDIRKYFVKDFYIDHVQRYKKRPIYWMFSSPKGYFNVLIYLHRYSPDTLNNILNNYLRQFIEKLKTRKAELKHVEVSGSATDKTKAIKEMDKIELMLADCMDYERNILYPLATERIDIDLDNGVLVNYNCFGKAVKEVKGLNDAKTKKEVRKFDWIDTSMIK